MNGFTKSQIILKNIKNRITQKTFIQANKVKKTDFVRNRKMPFSVLIFFLLNSVKCTLQKELTHFMSEFTKKGPITKSAFCQQRMKLKPEAFIELNMMLVDGFYSDDKIVRWNGFRLLCMDGSSLELPKSEELRQDFGVNNLSNMVPMAEVSTLYDLLNDIIIEAAIARSFTSDYAFVPEHLENIKERDLLILDRGYCALWLFFLIQKKGAEYLCRVPTGLKPEFDSFSHSDEKTRIIEVDNQRYYANKKINDLGYESEPYNLRLVKVELPNGETEVLATSLLDEKKYPTIIFKELYHQRWGIEVNYNHLKNHIEIGNFTGYSTLTIKQDFYANAFISNIQSLIIHDAQKELEGKCKDRKYKYKINKNLSIGYMKNKVIKIFRSKSQNFYRELVELFQIEPVPIREDRKFPRKMTSQKRKFPINLKRAL
jgi:hypothetical protein